MYYPTFFPAVRPFDPRQNPLGGAVEVPVMTTGREREIPLDLSLKAVRQTADSTAADVDDIIVLDHRKAVAAAAAAAAASLSGLSRQIPTAALLDPSLFRLPYRADLVPGLTSAFCLDRTPVSTATTFATHPMVSLFQRERCLAEQQHSALCAAAGRSAAQFMEPPHHPATLPLHLRPGGARGLYAASLPNSLSLANYPPLFPDLPASDAVSRRSEEKGAFTAIRPPQTTSSSASSSADKSLFNGALETARYAEHLQRLREQHVQQQQQAAAAAAAAKCAGACCGILPGMAACACCLQQTPSQPTGLCAGRNGTTCQQGPPGGKMCNGACGLLPPGLPIVAPRPTTVAQAGLAVGPFCSGLGDASSARREELTAPVFTPTSLWSTGLPINKALAPTSSPASKRKEGAGLGQKESPRAAKDFPGTPVGDKTHHASAVTADRRDVKPTSILPPSSKSEVKKKEDRDVIIIEEDSKKDLSKTMTSTVQPAPIPFAHGEPKRTGIKEESDVPRTKMPRLEAVSPGDKNGPRLSSSVSPPPLIAAAAHVAQQGPAGLQPPPPPPAVASSAESPGNCPISSSASSPESAKTQSPRIPNHNRKHHIPQTPRLPTLPPGIMLPRFLPPGLPPEAALLMMSALPMSVPAPAIVTAAPVTTVNVLVPPLTAGTAEPPSFSLATSTSSNPTETSSVTQAPLQHAQEQGEDKMVLKTLLTRPTHQDQPIVPSTEYLQRQQQNHRYPMMLLNSADVPKYTHPPISAPPTQQHRDEVKTESHGPPTSVQPGEFQGFTPARPPPAQPVSDKDPTDSGDLVAKAVKKSSMLQCLIDSEGYIGEKKSISSDLYADPSQLHREERALQVSSLRLEQRMFPMRCPASLAKKYNKNTAYEEELRREAKHLAGFRAKRKLRNRLLARLYQTRKPTLPEADGETNQKEGEAQSDPSAQQENQRVLSQLNLAWRQKRLLYTCRQVVRRRRFRSGLDMIARRHRRKRPLLAKLQPLEEQGGKDALLEHLPSGGGNIRKVDSSGIPLVPVEMKRMIVNKALGETVLHRAARLGYTDVVFYCLETNCCDINVRDNAGYTPLHECCARGQLEIARALLSYGADVDASATGGIRPLHDAIENDHVEVVRLLLSFGADPTIATYSGLSPLKLARSPIMTELLRGFLADIRGESDGNPVLPWQFAGSASCFDPEECGYDVFEGVPSETEGEGEGSDDFLFEVSDSPHLPTFRLQLPGGGTTGKAPCNCLRLAHVLKQMGLTREEFAQNFGHIDVVSVPRHEFETSATYSQLLTGTKLDSILGGNGGCTGEGHAVPEVGGGAMIEVVRLDNHIRDILGIETITLR